MSDDLKYYYTPPLGHGVRLIVIIDKLNFQSITGTVCHIIIAFELKNRNMLEDMHAVDPS